MKNAGLAVLFLGALIVAGPASAAVACTGSVTASWIKLDGAVLIYSSWRHDHTQLCNLKATWKGVTPEVCASWVAKMDAATSLGREVRIYYDSESVCASIATEASSPAPAWVMLL